MTSHAEAQAIRDLLTVAAQHEIPTLAIGASARQLILDQRYALPTRRTTLDWDFAIQVADWSTYRALIHALTAPPRAQFRFDAPHRLVHLDTQVRIDLVPFGLIAAPDDTLRWPEGEREMSVTGFTTALQYSETVQLEGQSLRVATLHWHVALKLLAYTDRELKKDLDDIDFMLSAATEALTDRVYTELADPLSEGKLAFNVAGAYLVGKDLSREATHEERRALLAILNDKVIREPDYLALSRLVPASLDETLRSNRIDQVIEHFQSLRRGLEESE